MSLRPARLSSVLVEYYHDVLMIRLLVKISLFRQYNIPFRYTEQGYTGIENKPTDIGTRE